MKLKQYLQNLILVIILIFGLAETAVFSVEKDLINLAESFNKNGEYYNAITETMRYQFLYPGGNFYPVSMLIMSEAYYKGGNYNKAVTILTECFERFKNKPEGEKAFYKKGYVQMVSGNPYLAFRLFQEYRYLYKDGSFNEDVSRDLCYSLTLMNDLKEADREIKSYEENYPEGKYLQEIRELQLQIDEQINRPKKNVWISVLGSIVIPGFGHFYTGKYDVGILSFVSNAILIGLFYDAYKDKSKARMIVFGLSEFSFYQYSLYSSISNVYEYNSNESFYKSIHLSASKEF
jgi:outer membrane protein assembly factor BamD (BamD/ComL family)